MKKLLAVLALLLVASMLLVACQTNPEGPEETTPEETTPEVTTPEETTPEDTTPEETTPEDTTPEETTPEDTTPEETTPEETTPPADPVTVHISKDELRYMIGEEQVGAGFPAGQFTSWTDMIATVEDYKVEYLVSWGWASFYGEAVGQFGYQIDDNAPVYDDAFAWETEQPVLDAAGGKPASRYKIYIPVRDLQGEHTIKALVKDAVGTEEVMYEFTMNKAVDPAAPVVMIDPATLVSTGTGAPDVAAAVLSEDGTYATLTNGTVGDPYITFRNINANAQFLAVKYRTDVAGKAFNFFVASTGNDATGQGDMAAAQSYVCDGQWHLAIVDISAVAAVNEENFISFFRYDFYTDGQNQDIDVAWIAAFNTAEYAQAYFAKSMLIADNTNVFTSDVNANETGAALGTTDLSNFFTLNLPLAGSAIEELDGAKVYHMTSINEMLADVNGAYYVKANVLTGAANATFFVRGYQVVNSDDIIAAFDPGAGMFKINNYYETDSNGSNGGAGIYATIMNGKLYILVKTYNADVVTRVGNHTFMIPCEGTELTIADDGYTVSIMVNGVTYATIALVGSQSYEDIKEVSPAGQFAAKAIVTLKDGTTETLENTLVAATVNSQVGVVSRAGSTKFSSIEVGGFSAIEVPALEVVEPEPVDPNAPIAIGDANYLAGAAMGPNNSQVSSAVVSEDGAYVTITSGEGKDPNFYVLSSGSMIPGVKYVAIKYRTTFSGTGGNGEFFIGSGANPMGGVDELKFEYIADGEWHVLILDISTVSSVNAEGLVNYIRYDFYLGAENTSIDIANIALFGSADAAYGYYGLENPNPETPAEPAEPLVVDFQNINDSDIQEFAAAQFSQKVIFGNYGTVVNLGYYDLSLYSKAIIKYATDVGYKNDGLAQIGFKSSSATWGQAGSFDGTDIIASAAMTDAVPDTFWALTGLRDAEIDLTSVDYKGDVWVGAYNVEGQIYAIESITLIP